MSIPQRLLRDGLIASSDRHPDKTVLIVEGRAYTYGELREASLRIARALLEHGVKRGDRVAIYMDNTWPCIVSLYGIMLAGGVFLLINPQTKEDKLSFVLQDSNAVVLFTDSHLAGQYSRAVQGLTHLRMIIASGDLSSGELAPVQTVSWSVILEETVPLERPAFIIPNDLAALIYTSGSTGRPKGVMQTHQSMVFAAWSLIEYLRLSEDERILLILPLAFDYGLYQLLMTVILGATLIVERSFTFPGLIYKRMREEHVTVCPGVPTIFATMIRGHQKRKLIFPEITRVTNTAAMLPVDFIPSLQEIFPNALLYKMYGLTECKRVSYLAPERIRDKPASVGKAIPGTEVFLRAVDGSSVQPGEPGILYVRGPHIMAGYWNQPDQTRKMLQSGLLPGERLLCTGDWFRMDDEGFLYFSGRSDDIINTRGEKVSPVEVEEVLLSFEGIQEAVVLGVDDVQLGQAISAFIVVQKGSFLPAGKIRKFCLPRLENFMVPKYIIELDDMPRTANGKIDKKILLQHGVYK